MNPITLCFALVLTLSSIISHACPSIEGAADPLPDLSVTSASFSVAEDAGQRTITTLGSVKNASASCVNEVVVEVKYFDDKKILIDTITQPVYGLVVPPTQEVAFRILDSAAKPKNAYASQTVRIVAADVRGSRNTKARSTSSALMELFISWGPMLLLIGVWIFFMRKMKDKNSPQVRSIALVEQQNAILESQSKLLERLAIASEAISTRNERS